VSKMQKVAYKPVGLLLGIGAGAVAGFVFKEVWKFASGDDDAPNATDEDRGWLEIIAAAALQDHRRMARLIVSLHRRPSRPSALLTRRRRPFPVLS
jgi:hypothetical protein